MTKGRKIAYWVGALLATVPLGALNRYAKAVERLQPGALVGQIAASGYWLFLGAYIGLYRLMPLFGREGRWHAEGRLIALGIGFIALSLTVQGYFPSRDEFFQSWAAFGGYFLLRSVEKPPAPNAAQAGGERPGA